jgi:hypothetical protein
MELEGVTGLPEGVIEGVWVIYAIIEPIYAYFWNTIPG